MEIATSLGGVIAGRGGLPLAIRSGAIERQSPVPDRDAIRSMLSTMMAATKVEIDEVSPSEARYPFFSRPGCRARWIGVIKRGFPITRVEAREGDLSS
jgi:hypothetical protein